MEIFIVGLIVAVIVTIISICNVAKDAKQIRETMQNSTEELKSLSFNIDKTFQYNHFLLYVDNVNKKWAVVLNNKPIIYNYSDLLNFEIIEDGIPGGNMGKAVVGAALFGITGAVIGSSGSSPGKCSSLILWINVNDLKRPEVTFNFISSPTKKTSATYQLAMKKVREAGSILRFIQANK